MEQTNPTTMQIDRSGTFEKVPDCRGALIRLSILLGLWGWMFWPEIAQTLRLALGQSDTVHLAVLPVAVLLVLLARRKDYLESLGHGSAWGVVIAAGGLLFFASMLWPFSFGYFRLWY